jgi:ribosomal protein L19E|tara:strand:+ start:81 stop:245 length:165 start_codon:yes stop_codon:yes gene_type:complete
MEYSEFETYKKKKQLYEIIRAYRDAIKNIREKGKTPKFRTFKRMYHFKERLKDT